MNPRKKRVLICVSAVLLILAAAGAFWWNSEKNAVLTSLTEAENIRLALGSYESPSGVTGTLPEEELQFQIDLYQGKIDHYYAPENPCYDSYKNQHEMYLRQDFDDAVSYRVKGGVLEHRVNGFFPVPGRSEATMEVSFVTYNMWVEETENGDFQIKCTASLVDVVAKMVKIDGLWKFLGYDRFQKVSDWMPQDVLVAKSQTELQNYAMRGAREAAEVSAALLTDVEYGTFEEALATAEKIDVGLSCPLAA